MPRTQEAAAEIASGIRKDAEEEAAQHDEYRLLPGDLDVIEAMALFLALNQPSLDGVQIADLLWPIYDELHTEAQRSEADDVISVPIDTIEGAMAAVKVAEEDTDRDHGPGAAASAYNDLVRSIAAVCYPEVAAELFQRTGVQPL